MHEIRNRHKLFEITATFVCTSMQNAARVFSCTVYDIFCFAFSIRDSSTYANFCVPFLIVGQFINVGRARGEGVICIIERSP